MKKKKSKIKSVEAFRKKLAGINSPNIYGYLTDRDVDSDIAEGCMEVVENFMDERENYILELLHLRTKIPLVEKEVNRALGKLQKALEEFSSKTNGITEIIEDVMNHSYDDFYEDFSAYD